MNSLVNYVVDWYMDQGVVDMFGVMAGITVAMTLTTLPMYVFGKRYRNFWQHHNLLVKFGLRDEMNGIDSEPAH